MQRLISNETGSVMNIALLIIIMLVLLGIGFNRGSTTDIKITGNSRQHLVAFYGADGGTEVGARLAEENLGCSAGFTSSGNEPVTNIPILDINNVRVRNLILAHNAAVPAFTAPDAYYPLTNTIGSPGTTQLAFQSQAAYAPGSGIQMVSGYESMGHGAASGGSLVLVSIASQYVGNGNSQSRITMVWRHVVGLELPCSY